MTIHLPTKPFRDALALLQPLASSKSLPQLGAVIINDRGGAVNLSATNLNIWMTINLEAPTHEPFSLSLPSEKLHKALSMVSTPEFSLEQQETAIRLTAGAYTISFPILTDPVMPVPEVEWGKPFTMELLPNYFHKLLPFASKMIGRERLHSIHMGKGIMEAASGYSFCRLELPCKGEAVVPTKLAEMVAGMTGDVKVRLSENLAEFSGEDWVITGSLIEGDYPNVGSFITAPEKVHTTITVDRKQFIEAIQSVAVSLDKIEGMWARNTAGEMRVETPKQAEHPSSYTIPAKTYNPVDFAFRPSLMIAAMKAVDCELVTLEMEQMPRLISCKNGNTLVGLLGMRLEA